MDRHTEATLMRKKTHQKRQVLVMRGRTEELIRYVMTTPKAHRNEYRLVAGKSEYGPPRIQALAHKFGISAGEISNDGGKLG